MKLRLSRRAQDDLLAIGRYIANDNPRAARVFVARLKRRARTALRHPRVGRQVPEYEREDLRELVEGNYRIVYKVEKRAIVVVAIVEGHRLLPQLAVP